MLLTNKLLKFNNYKDCAAYCSLKVNIFNLMKNRYYKHIAYYAHNCILNETTRYRSLNPKTFRRFIVNLNCIYNGVSMNYI